MQCNDPDELCSAVSVSVSCDDCERSSAAQLRASHRSTIARPGCGSSRRRIAPVRKSLSAVASSLRRRTPPTIRARSQVQTSSAMCSRPCDSSRARKPREAKGRCRAAAVRRDAHVDACEREVLGTQEIAQPRCTPGYGLPEDEGQRDGRCERCERREQQSASDLAHAARALSDWEHGHSAAGWSIRRRGTRGEIRSELKLIRSRLALFAMARPVLLRLSPRPRLPGGRRGHAIRRRGLSELPDLPPWPLGVALHDPSVYPARREEVHRTSGRDRLRL